MSCKQQYLSESQDNAYIQFKNGKNLLILGEGGTGKSFLIKYLQSSTSIPIHITSTTGISAYNIGGVTIHSLLGIGIGTDNIDTLVRKINRNSLYRNNILDMKILVIDEISMLSAELFEKINELCQRIRQNNLFFGGIQVIFTGDFLQLLCFFNKNREIYGNNLDERLLVESDTFNKEFSNENNNIIILKTNFRQNDITFKELLLQVRKGTLTQESIELINTRNILPNNEDMIHLVSTNKQTQIINTNKLKLLKSKTYKYIAKYTQTGKNIKLCELLKKELQYQLKQKSLDILELKLYSRVMLIKNIDVVSGLVNGSTGTIIDINEEFIDVKFDNGIVFSLNSLEINNININNCKVSVTQIPLILAYALTINKSQGLTLDKAIIDISNCFTYHMVYTALSRVKSLDGIYLHSKINTKKIIINEIILKYLNKLI